MSESDRELLELAAKAASIKWPPSKSTFPQYDCDQREWNPLIDDGDALRLAVKLKINIFSGVMHVIAEDQQGNLFKGENGGDDVCAATRRAIVRAAAAIGNASDGS